MIPRHSLSLACAALALTSVAAHAAEPRYYRSEATAKAGLPVSNAVQVGEVLYVSNQLGNGASGGGLVGESLKAQLDQTMSNIDAVLAANGAGRDAVFRCMVALKDIAGDSAELNRLWLGYFKAERLPVRNVIGAAGLPLGARVTVECQAAAPRR
jgi:enamine deaminase RidA (YjgF/YER057c/UK114 family)